MQTHSGWYVFIVVIPPYPPLPVFTISPPRAYVRPTRSLRNTRFGRKKILATLGHCNRSLPSKAQPDATWNCTLGMGFLCVLSLRPFYSSAASGSRFVFRGRTILIYSIERIQPLGRTPIELNSPSASSDQSSATRTTSGTFSIKHRHNNYPAGQMDFALSE